MVKVCRHYNTLVPKNSSRLNNVVMSRARAESPPLRPTTPLRPTSRTSLRSSTNNAAHLHGEFPLDTLEPQFAELSDSLADLESNLLHLQLMHESLSRFSENFAAFLYGLEMNAFVVDWPEQPLVESIQRWCTRQKNGGDAIVVPKTPTKGTINVSGSAANEVDSTLLSDTTFASLKATPARRRTMAAEESKTGVAARGRGAGNAQSTAKKTGLPSRGGSTAENATRGARVGRGSSIPSRGRSRGLR